MAITRGDPRLKVPLEAWDHMCSGEPTTLRIAVLRLQPQASIMEGQRETQPDALE